MRQSQGYMDETTTSSGWDGTRTGVLAVWRTSSYSPDPGDDGEVERPWRESPEASVPEACVRVVNLPRVHGISDSRNPDDGALYFGSPEWDAFVTAARNGHL